MRKPSANRDFPPPLELECLNAIWALGEGNVKAVQDALAPRKQLAYTTIMTLLERLVKRGALARRKVGRTFVYVPTVARQEIRRQAVDQLLTQHFEGSAEALMDYLRNGLEAAPEPIPATPAQANQPAATQSAARESEEREPVIDTTLL